MMGLAPAQPTEAEGASPAPAAKKAAEAQTVTPREIKKLDEAVVNRIAAGEIIHRPANALKELIENSLDAGSTAINVTVKNGGLKLLQIQDNGCGIRKDDMGIVCERFTTSKLRDFDDLKSINTFGFRGEALASITHVAHLSITTRTKTDTCAWKAHYSDGVLVPGKPGTSAEPKPFAGNPGTTITVEDLFFNMATRRKALKSPSEEYNKIVEVVSRYAIENPHVAFSCKKHGENSADVRTSAGVTSLDNIRGVFGNSVARELLEVRKENKELEVSVAGLVSNANYSVKKGTFIFFINKRLVDCSILKKGIEAVYAAYLPKNTQPFVYLSLTMAPQHLDVNVHPTKQEVHFLNEEQVVEFVQRTIEDKMLTANSSRSFLTQTLLTGGTLDESAPKPKGAANGVGAGGRPYEHQMVRTDSRARTLHSYMHAFQAQAQEAKASETEPSQEAGAADEAADTCCAGEEDTQAATEQQAMEVDAVDDDIMIIEKPAPAPTEAPASSGTTVAFAKTVRLPRQRHEVNLTSVLEMRAAIERKENKGLRETFKKHTFVGCVDRNLALMQFETKLYLVNVTKVSKMLFAQLTWWDFSNFGSIRLAEPLPIRDLLYLALDNPETGYSEEEFGPKDQLVENMFEELITKADLLAEYFMIGIEDGHLAALPLYLEHYIPDWDRLPMFVLRMCTEVEWGSEQDCFRTMAEELSNFYCFRPNPFEADTSRTSAESAEGDAGASALDVCCNSDRNWMWTVEHVLFPAFRKHLRPSRDLAEGAVIPIADLPELYKVFERC